MYYRILSLQIKTNHECNKLNRSRQFKFFSVLVWSQFATFPALLGIVIYSLKSLGVACHFDEWSGRGIYPSLALINGSDMYETTKGPLVTLYGFGTAFFYLPSTIASDPTELIWIAFLCNLIGLIIPLAYVFRKINQDKNGSKFNNFLFVTYLCIAFLFLTQLEVSTLGLLKIHADLPAFSFLLLGFAFFVAYEKDKKICFLILTGLSLSLSVWSKLPTLPAVLFPLLYLLTEKRLKESLLYFSYFLLTFSLVSLVIFKAYGFKDVLYYIIEFPSYSRWSYRNDLFDGSNAVLKNHSYIEGIPLLFRFFVMYLEEYWYMLLANLSVLILSINFAGTKKVIFRSVGLIAFLTLPTCLTHLARFGAVENALIFTNSFSLLGFILLMYSFCETKLQKPFRNLALVLIAFLSSPTCFTQSQGLAEFN